MRFVGRVLTEVGQAILPAAAFQAAHADLQTRTTPAESRRQPRLAAPQTRDLFTSRARYLFMSVVLSVAAMGQSLPNAQDAARSAMAASVDKQRASILIQVNSVLGKTAPPVGSFFSAPWVEAAFAEPTCDAIASPELDQLIEQNSKTQGVKPELIRAIISQESANRPCAVSPKGAQGL